MIDVDGTGYQISDTAVRRLLHCDGRLQPGLDWATLKLMQRNKVRHRRVPQSLDHLVSARKQCGWDRQADHFGSLEVHDQVELCRLLDR